ncbi:MAG: hypothetical protein FWF75_10465 [Propionibacteriaceae bacterium]|nr:hypothetical protein [Propionibacteriaceae bacterium]
MMHSWTTSVTVALGVIFIVIAVGFFVTALRTSRDNRTWRTAHAGEQEPPEIIAARTRWSRDFPIMFGPRSS